MGLMVTLWSIGKAGSPPKCSISFAPRLSSWLDRPRQPMKTNNLGLEATRLSPFRLHRILFANARVLKIATIFLSFLSFAAVSVHAQAPREAPRPGIAQDFIAWLRHLAPTQRRQSRAVPLPRPRPAVRAFAQTRRTKQGAG